jgi:hypothetical protein
MHQHFAGRRADGTHHGRRVRLRDALITLAMVVCADIEIMMRLTAIPANELVTIANGDITGPDTLRIKLGVAQPTAGNHGMRFQELNRTGRAHLRRNHARDVFLKRDIVDHAEPAALDQPNAAAKHLAFLAFPMKADADRDVVQGKRRFGVLRAQIDF